MATKAKESIVDGKEKKVPSSTSPITSTKRTTKPSQTTTTSTNKPTSSTPSDKNIPNYLKPTKSSRLESPSSFKQPKSTDVPNKPNLNRRRSLDRPLSSSNITKQKQPSPSRLHKALVSPGPRERVISPQSSRVPVKSTKPSNPISDKTSKINPREGKTKLVYVKKSIPSLSSSTSTKKVANDHAKKSTAGTTEGSKVETTEEVKEVTNQEVEVIKKENEENQAEHEVSEISPHVESEHDEHEHEHEHEHDLEESDQPHNQANDHEKVISTVSEEELKNELQEEKTEEKHEEEENTNHDDSNNNGSHPEEQSEAEEKQEQEEEVVVSEKEDEGGVIIEDHTSENNNEEEAVVEEKEIVEGGTSEGVEEAKVEATPPMQHGKKESQISNDAIEETTNKLLEARKNKVRAMAGAFQTVIDNQSTSK